MSTTWELIFYDACLRENTSTECLLKSNVWRHLEGSKHLKILYNLLVSSSIRTPGFQQGLKSEIKLVTA